MEVPESVKIGLANIKPTLHARWNPQGKQVGGWSFDVNGQPRHKEWEGRWELWDRSESGNDYKVTTLEGRDGGYVPLGDWVFGLMHQINPANYDGDMNRVIEALVDKPNEDITKLGDEQFENLLEFLTDYCWHEKAKGSTVSLATPRM